MDCQCRRKGAKTCPVHPNRAGDGRENTILPRPPKKVSSKHCICQHKGATVCPVHPSRSGNLPRSYASGKSGRRIAYLMDRDGPYCYFCGIDLRRDDVIATADHLTPKALGGNNLLSNLVACCYVCNHAKGNRTEEQFRHCMSNGMLTNRVKRAQADVAKRLANNGQDSDRLALVVEPVYRQQNAVVDLRSYGEQNPQ